LHRTSLRISWRCSAGICQVLTRTGVPGEVGLTEGIPGFDMVGPRPVTICL
jgi:hypothetical protein